MAFTVDNAKTLAETNTDEDMTDAQALEWAKEFMRQKVASRRWTEGTQEYEDATEDEWEDLPADFVSVVEMLDEDENAYEDYEYRSGQIRFGADGTYTMHYRQFPTALSAVTATVPLPDIYLDPLAYFLASRYRSMDDSEDADALRWMAECDKALRRNLGTARASSKPLRVQFRW